MAGASLLEGVSLQAFLKQRFSQATLRCLWKYRTLLFDYDKPPQNICKASIEVLSLMISFITLHLFIILCKFGTQAGMWFKYLKIRIFISQAAAGKVKSEITLSVSPM